VLAIAYRSRNVPQALMNLRLNNGIAEHKDVETTMIYTHDLKEGEAYEKSGGCALSSFGKRRFYPEPDKAASCGSRRHKWHEQTVGGTRPRISGLRAFYA
jgi:hypothetical protein